MADGNLGSLWMSLGLKETVSDGLKKVLSSLDKTDEKSAAVGKEIKSFIKDLSSAKVSDSLLKSIGRIGELLSVSTSGAESLGRVLKGLNVKEMSALGGNINMSNLKEAHSLVTKIIQAMSSRNMSNASMDKFFDLSNAQGFLTQIMNIDKNLKSLKDSSKGITDTVLKGDAKALVDKLTSLRKQFLESFNSGLWRGNNDIQTQLSNATNGLIQFYDKLNASKGNQSLFDSIPKEAAKTNEALKATEEQAKKTADAVASIGTKRKPAVENQELAKEIERISKTPAYVKEGSNDIAGVKKQADDAKESVIKLRYELNEVLNAFRGSASKNLGVGEAGEKGRQYVDILNQVNKKIEEISKREGGDKAAAEIKAMLNSAQSYIDLLERIRKKYIEISDIRTTNPNVDTAKIKEALGLISHFREQLTQLESGRFLTGVDKSNVLSNYGKAWTSTVRTVDEITKGLSNTNTLSDLKNKADKANISVSTLQTKISELEKLIDNGKQRGFNTDKLFDNLAALRNRKIEFDRALNEDPKRLNNDAYMTGLYSETAKDLRLAADAMEQFRQVQQKVSEQEKVLSSEYARRSATEKQRQTERDAELKAMDAYAKRYMELVAARDKAMASMKEAPGLKNDKGLLNISNEIDTLLKRLGKVREDITLYNQAIGNGTKESIAFGQQGLKEANAEAERLMATIENLQRVYDTLRNSQSHVDDLVGNTFAKKRNQDTLAKMSEFYKAEEKASAKKAAQDEAQSKRDAAKATREANAAEKQRQTELENSLRRIQSMEKALANLQEKRFTSKMFGFDVSEADAKIFAMKIKLNELYDIARKLESKDMSAVGKLGNLGNGRETQAANNLARSYDKANKEAQRGVDIEQKRQQEIAKSSAKVQADLVRGFEKANSHAGKLNSTIQDLKSLFLQGGLVFGAQQFAMSIITTGGEMEKQHIALQSILGDMQNANTLFGQIKELALNSPFTFSELNRDVKQLAAYGVEYDQLYDTTKRLADMSSGLGVSFDRIALAFGQVQARGWLDGKELRQIAYAGIPLLDKLSDFYSKQEGRKVSTSEIKTRISNREVSFDDVKNIFWQMTDAGGQFYNMQQTLSETLLGRYNKLKDAWEIMLADFANGKSVVGGTFMFIINKMTDLVQLMHSFSPMLLGLFSGVAMKKIGVALAGSAASNFLSNKEKIAQDIKARAIAGQQLSQTEMRVLATKKQITREDLQALITAKAITKTELQRLYLSGKISKEMYKQAVTSAGMNNLWTNFANKGGVAISLLGKGIASLGSSLWTMIGGWPGLILTAVTASIGYIYSEYQDLSQKIKQTQDELADRNSQILSFLKDNNVSVAITKGDDKEIDNMIDAYKEKLKQIAPYDYHNLVMTTDEMKSHKDRLLYLEKELKLLKEANDVANSKMSNRSFYSDMSDDTEKAIEALNKRKEMQIAANKPGASVGEKQMYADEKAYSDYIEKLKNRIAKKFGDIAKDEKMRQAAMQSMSALFSSLGVPEDRADLLRTSLLQAFGIGDKSNWLQTQVGDKMRSLIDSTFPLIGDKIKSNIPLTEAEKAKVKELMGDAKNGLIQQYPELERTLQGMLAASKFEAVIKLVVDGNSYNDMQSELVSRIPKGPLKPELLNKYRKRANEYGKDNNWYNGRNAARSNIDSALNNWEGAKKSKAKDTQKLYQDYLDEMAISNALLYYDYKGEGKKSNKPEKKNKGRQEDEDLKRLRKRIDLYKKFYTELEKYRKLYGRSGALAMLNSEAEFKPVFKSFGLSDPGTYGTSIREMLKKVPLTTNDRKDYYDSEIGNIHAKNRSEEEDRIKTENDQLTKRLDILSEQYETYKKLYELTGNSDASSQIAFGYVQSGTLKDYLNEQMKWAVQDHNNLFGSSFTPEEVFGMDENDFKQYFGENSENISVIYDAMRKENEKFKKETIDLMADLIEKNATIEQQIEDENRKYERQLEIIKGIEDPQMRQRAKEGATKTHNENKAKLQFEQFKQESDWVTIFDDLDRVSSATIDSMVSRIDELSRTTGLSVEVVKQLRDALDKLKSEQIERNPIPDIFGGTHRGNAIGSFIKDRLGKNADGEAKVFVSEGEAAKMGIIGNQAYTKNQLENEQKKAYNDSSKAISAFASKMQALQTALDPVINLFQALGQQDSVLGKITGGLSGAFGTAASTKSAFDTLGKIKGFEFLEKAGPYAAAASAGLSVASSLLSAFGADYSSYNKAKAEYDNLTSVWDSLISKKTEYMNIHWGAEATEASKEAQEMLQAEIEQTKIIAQKRLNSGASAGSHSLWYRMWKGSYKYNGQNWRDVAGEISSKYGVQFNGMDDLLNMNSDTLSKIKQDYVGLWATMDGDFRDYLEKLIEYGEKADDMIDALTEKLTGNKFSDTVSAWGDAMAQMSNSSDSLVDNFENNLKKAILNSMIENVYGNKIKALIEKTKKYAENGDKITDESGNVISEYTGAEYADVKESTDDLSKQIEATRDFLKKTYGWSDNSSSSSTNSVKGITEEEANLGLSYLNAIRLDCSVIREEQAKYFPEMSEIAKSQLTQLNMISQNTLRNAEAAERIESIFTSYNDNFNKVLNGTKQLKVK